MSFANVAPFITNPQSSHPSEGGIPWQSASYALAWLPPLAREAASPAPSTRGAAVNNTIYQHNNILCFKINIIIDIDFLRAIDWRPRFVC